jgi:peptidyl-prolyl cis-trans isomerase A (cyclophilin A)
MTVITHEATLHTNHGDIRVGLYGLHAPKTVKNFVGLATGEQAWTHPNTGEAMSTPLYEGVVFHRVIAGFMIQGGDPLGTGTGGPGYQFDDEIHPELAFNDPYLLAMANAGRRGGQGTNGSQFFITVAPTPWLQGNHTIFGRVLDDESQDVVRAIEAVDTDGSDRPRADVIIERVSVTEVS